MELEAAPQEAVSAVSAEEEEEAQQPEVDCRPEQKRESSRLLGGLSTNRWEPDWSDAPDNRRDESLKQSLSGSQHRCLG